MVDKQNIMNQMIGSFKSNDINILSECGVLIQNKNNYRVYGPDDYSFTDRNGKYKYNQLNYKIFNSQLAKKIVTTIKIIIIILYAFIIIKNIIL